MKKVVIAGAGMMGLTLAYNLLRRSYSVTLFEANETIGGMSSHFDFDGLDIERFYHFVCAPDQSMFDLLKELGIYEKLKWSKTKMSYFIEGNHYRWGDPLYLMKFPLLDLFSKIRYGLMAFYTTKIKNWSKLDRIDALKWLRSWLGEKGYEILWDKLFKLKFYEYTENLSAAWIGTRIKRVGLSRKNIFEERLGYIEGGSKTLFSLLEKKIRLMGGQIFVNTPVEKVNIKNNKIESIEIKKEKIEADYFISTVPLPYIPKIIPDLPGELKNKYMHLRNISIICVILKLDKPVTDNFWLNINDRRIQIPGLIEYSNLNPLGNHIVYLPFYMPENHSDYKKNDQYFISQSKVYLKIINPHINEKSIIGARVFRYEYAQPICPPGYLEGLPSIQTKINGLFIADTSYYYPEDRSVSESIRLGHLISEMI
jgi:protoporphyrinogen oxidase